MVVLAVITNDEQLEKMYMKYQQLFKQVANKELSFSEKQEIFREIEYSKTIINAYLADFEKSSILEINELELQQISPPLLKAQLMNAIYTSDSFRILVEANVSLLEKTSYVSLQDVLSSGQLLLFWNIEESEWRELLSN